jgi:hypothetical protein
MQKNRVLIYITGGQIFQELDILDEANKYYLQGDEVLLIACDKTCGGCMENSSFCSLYCCTLGSASVILIVVY